MMELLTSNEGTLALRVDGHLSMTDMERVLDELEKRLASSAPIHIYAEILSVSGVDDFRPILPRSRAFFAHLERFGRVAIVSDIAWVRWASRLESALLPKISYRIFSLDEAAQARAWVDGDSSLAHGRSIRIIETDHPDVLGLAVDGTIAAAEMRAITARLLSFFRNNPRPRFLARLGRIQGFEPAGALTADFLRMKLDAARRMDRYAIVGGEPWVKTWIETVSHLAPGEVRFFERNEESAAWEWLGARPTEELEPPLP